jgi:isoleucyl-tRNA synthetase
VPIPAVKCAECAEVAPLNATMDRVEEIFAREGSDAWYSRPVMDFVAPGTKCAKCGAGVFTKTEDILDVWFDSGSSQAAVLAKRPELKWPADAYLEAVEQARGWFGSSLVCAASERGVAPFKSVISHGLTVDEKGRKMSKSLGNSEDAVDAAGRMGADVLRLVYASLDYTTDIALGPTIFNAVSEAYRKIRNTCRFVLGNLADFEPKRDAVELKDMLEFDRFILARTEKLKSEVRRAYDGFEFQTAFQLMQNFIVVDLSSLYIDVARDRLYCSAEKSRERRSAQTALFNVLDALIRMLAALIPFTAEEVYSYMPGAKLQSVHLTVMHPANPAWRDADLEARWEDLLTIRSGALKALEELRACGAIGAPLDAELEIFVGGQSEAKLVAKYREDLANLSIVSDVKVDALRDKNHFESLVREWHEKTSNQSPDFKETIHPIDWPSSSTTVIFARHASGVKCARCWKFFDDGGSYQLDARCRAVVGA